MSSRRPAILTGVLLILVLGYVYQPYWIPDRPGSSPKGYVTEPVLAGESSLSNLTVGKNQSGVWQANFDYFYTGKPEFVGLFVEFPKDPTPSVPTHEYSGRKYIYNLKRGLNHVTVDIPYPGSARTTHQVIVKMLNLGLPASAGADHIVASATIDQLIDWPSYLAWTQNLEFEKHSSEENLNRATGLIDQNGSEQLAEAKFILERLVNRDPSTEQVYIQLARVAMKSNWGPEGFHQAEGFLASALQIDPGSANAKILAGYVYTHQERYSLAEKAFTEAAASHPKNPWLWTNWGETLLVQGKLNEAAAKYREAIEYPVTHDAYDLARAYAYTNLLALLKRNNDLDGMEALYKRRLSEFGNGSCYSTDYARFLLLQRDDATGAIDLAHKALDLNCEDGGARQVLGLAKYVTWSKSEGAPRAEALNQARIYLPPGPMPIYLLASSDKTLNVVSQLIAAGERLDQKDNENLNALAHAIESNDLPAMQRLLRLGAKPDTLVGFDNMPVALLPVMSGNVQMIKLLQRSGADYAKIRYQGVTAFEIAKQTGNSELLEVLSRKRQVL